MNNYNDFYLLIENEIEAINKTINTIQNAKYRHSKSKLLQRLIDKKEVVINEAFENNNVPFHLQEEFRDNLFSDEEFDHLLIDVA